MLSRVTGLDPFLPSHCSIASLSSASAPAEVGVTSLQGCVLGGLQINACMHRLDKTSFRPEWLRTCMAVKSDDWVCHYVVCERAREVHRRQFCSTARAVGSFACCKSDLRDHHQPVEKLQCRRASSCWAWRWAHAVRLHHAFAEAGCQVLRRFAACLYAAQVVAKAQVPLPLSYRFPDLSRRP